MSFPLWQIEQFGDVFTDALVRNDSGHLMFMSIFGRDTAIQQLLAAFSLPVGNGGVDRIKLREVGETGTAQIAFVGDARRLTKLTGKLPGQPLFGVLSHVFIFDESIGLPDRANGTGWVLSAGNDHGLHARQCWQMIRRLSSVPLLDRWRDAVIDALGPTIIVEMDDSHTWGAIGRVKATRIDLGESFPMLISQLVKNRTLTRFETSSIQPERAAA